MAVSSVDTLTGPYTTNGVTTTFPFTFKAMDESEVRVFRIASTGIETEISPGAYDVTLEDDGGSVIFTEAPAAGDPLYIGTDPDFTQQITFENQGAFLPEVMNEALDRAAVRTLAIKRDVDRSIRVPLGEESAVLPPILDRANKYLGFDSEGIPIPVTAFVDLAANAALGIEAGDADMGTTPGTILSDNGTAKDWFGESEAAIEARPTSAALAADAGSGLIGFKRPGLTGAAARTQEAKNKDIFDLRDIDGVDLSGSNDNLSALQAAINQAVADKTVLHIPGGVIAVDGTIQVPQGFSMQGIGRAAKGPASRFLFTSLLPGFVCGDGTDPYEEGFLFRDIVTSRDQPPAVTTGTWDAVDADADFVMNGAAQLNLQHVLFLNSTRGVNMEGGGSIGRLYMNECGGQVFVYGINIELAADVCKISNVHWWPYWADTKPVNAFSCANADHFYIKRCDTPLFTNVTSIASRSGFRFASNAYGKTTKALIANAGLDYATTNIWFDSTCDGTYAWFSNLAVQANNSDGGVANIEGVTPRRNIRMDGANCSLGISGCDIGGASGSAVEVKGTTNEVTFDGFVYVHNYGEEGGTEPCFLADAGSRVFLPDRVRNDATALGALAGGAGRIDGSWLNYAPSVTPQGGALTSVTVNDAKFIRKGTKVTGRVTLTFADAGGAAGYIRISAPTAIDNTFTAAAVNISTSQPVITVSIIGSPGFIQLQKAGGGNTAVTGETISVSFEYEMANG